MATKKRSGLGRGIGALIPQSSGDGERPVDVFFPSGAARDAEEREAAGRGAEGRGAEDRDGAAAHGAADRETGSGGDNAGTGVKDRDASGIDPATAPSSDSARAAAGASTAAGGAAGAAAGEDRPSDDEHRLRAVPGATLTRLAVADVVPNRVQPRVEFDEEALEELTHSVREFGVFQPIVVRAIEPAPVDGSARYELIMGERRLRASIRAGLSDIPAIIRSTADEHMLRDALLENLHRAELNPLEEASAYQQLLSDFGITQEQLAERIGRSRPQISNTIRLLKLPEPVQARVAAGVLSAGHARAILSLDGDAEAMQRLADKIVNEGLSVRAAETAAGSAAPKPRQRPRAGGIQAQLDEIAERLGDRFNTRVGVKLGAKKGQIVIDFATVQDLRRILDDLGDPGFN